MKIGCIIMLECKSLLYLYSPMLSLHFIRFVDCDIFMRFRGGGVGHRATRKHTKHMSQEADTTIPDKNDDDFVEDEIVSEEEQWEDNDSETSSESSDIRKGDHEDVDDEFDGEDGEEPRGIDEYTAEGYAPP